MIPPDLKLSVENTVRDPIRVKLVQILQTPPNIPNEPLEEYDEPSLHMAARIALDIEERMYKKFNDLKAYVEKARSIFFNLKDPKNPKLRYNIFNQFLSAQEVVESDSKVLASEEK